MLVAIIVEAVFIVALICGVMYLTIAYNDCLEDILALRCNVINLYANLAELRDRVDILRHRVEELETMNDISKGGTE